MTTAVEVPYEQIIETIKEGKTARIKGVPKNPPYGLAIGLQITLRHYWLAGWNDTDKEINKRMGC